MADVESLELRITGDSKSATDGLDALINTLDTLSTKTKGGMGLSTISKNIGKLAAEAGKLRGSEGEKLNSLAAGLKALSTLGSIKLPSGMANQISAVGDAIRSLDGVDTTRVRELALSLAPLDTLKDIKLGSFRAQLEKLPKTIEALDNIDLTALAAKLKQLADAFKPLADEMQKVGNGFSALPADIKKYADAASKIPSANAKSSKSFGDLVKKAAKVIVAFKAIYTSVGSWIAKSSAYNENMNLFSVAMGEYAEEALTYANQVEAAMGIDPSEWVRSQGVFMTLGKGFGIAGERANKMSQQLTQLGYDISSFYNISVEEAMDKLKSGFSGELEPLRNLGFDLSQAKLEAIAMSLGIDKAVSSMTQAEKAELRYYAIMTQVTDVHGDMARTLNEPANQMRIFRTQLEMAARSLGNIFIPIVNDLLPYGIAAVKVFRELADAVALLVGYEFPEVGDFPDTGNEVAAGFSDANEEVAKMKKMLLGIDELNVMSDNSSDSSDYGGSSFSFDLPTYKFLDDAADNRVNEIVDKMKDWLGISGELNNWADLFKTRLGNILVIVGLITVGFAAWAIIKSVAGVIDVFSKFKGAGADVPDAGGDVAAVSKTTAKLKTLVKDLGLGLVVILEVAAAAALIVGAIWLLGVELEQVGIAWEPVIANGQTIAIAMGIGVGILAAVGLVTYTLGKQGKTLAKDMLLGMAVLAEIGVAAGLFIVEIWAIGVGLDAIGKAWQPVLDNGANIAIAIGIGTGFLLAIGLAAAALGMATTATGGALPLAVGLGTAMLAELGIAAGLFILEILAVGKGLDEVGKAWQPVLDNGETIATGIGIGTGLLLAIGVVTAALGAVTVASAGTLPAAIGIGTGVLLELGGAFVLFTDELVIVAKQLTDKLAPALDKMVEDLPGLSKGMEDYTKFMGDFALKIVDYTISSAISGIAATIDKVIDFFTTDPIERLADEVYEQHGELDTLVTNLTNILPVIEDADRLMGQFNADMDNLKAKMGIKGSASGTIGHVISVGVSLVKKGWTSLSDWVGNLATTLNIKLPHVGIDWVDTGFAGIKYPKFSVDYYASGGFPTEGQMFVAREAGPELVGSIGNRTAVVNNDQIVSAVSQGVYQAVVQAMGQSSGNQVVEAKVNDKVLFEVVLNRNRQETMRKGYNPLVGGV